MKHIFLLCFTYILITGCDPVVYFPDPNDFRLPIYSTVGNNLAGCYINGEAWTSDKNAFEACVIALVVFPGNCAPSSATIAETETGFYLEFEPAYLQENELGNKKIIFTVEDEIYSDALNKWDYLRGKTYDLQGDNSGFYANYSLYEIIENDLELITSTEGLLKFSNETVGDIIAGTFYFKTATEDGQSVHVLNGRFDFKVKD